ncbi:MAG TPA: mercury methylation corrinoid protein HgcA [Desulfatiglandales bacterium]|nr:mercury methylation corrinoid protein HgcA [Desulfatiglandales bacterium]
MGEREVVLKGVGPGQNQKQQSCCGSDVDTARASTGCSQGQEIHECTSRMKQAFVRGTVQTPIGPVPGIFSSLVWSDRRGNIKARWGAGRMHYTVEPGLYALGRPDEGSPVLVTANYKMSFDRLREALPDRHAWILVLDTKGINVWCSAGKGTFGTEKLVERIESSRLSQVVSHRRLILPQLAGPGVAAHRVKKLSGFTVIYGPIRARDLPAFLDADLKATPDMRRKTFTAWERAVLIPVELVSASKWTCILIPVFFFLGGLGGPAGFWANAFTYGLTAALALLGSLAAGAVLTPLLLPWLPGRAFSLKGLSMGLLTALLVAVFRGGDLGLWSGRLEILAWFFLVPAIAAYLAMNFTGASTYTSLSGVKREMKWAVPMEVAAGAVGLCLWLGSRFVA